MWEETGVLLGVLYSAEDTANMELDKPDGQTMVVPDILVTFIAVAQPAERIDVPSGREGARLAGLCSFVLGTDGSVFGSILDTDSLVLVVPQSMLLLLGVNCNMLRVTLPSSPRQVAAKIRRMLTVKPHRNAEGPYRHVAYLRAAS